MNLVEWAEAQLAEADTKGDYGDTGGGSPDKPPGLRKATGTARCGRCSHFGDNACKLHGNYSVSASDVCEDYAAIKEASTQRVLSSSRVQRDEEVAVEEASVRGSIRQLPGEKWQLRNRWGRWIDMFGDQPVVSVGGFGLARAVEDQGDKVLVRAMVATPGGGGKERTFLAPKAQVDAYEGPTAGAGSLRDLPEKADPGVGDLGERRRGEAGRAQRALDQAPDTRGIKREIQAGNPYMERLMRSKGVGWDPEMGALYRLSDRDEKADPGSPYPPTSDFVLYAPEGFPMAFPEDTPYEEVVKAAEQLGDGAKIRRKRGVPVEGIAVEMHLGTVRGGKFAEEDSDPDIEKGDPGTTAKDFLGELVDYGGVPTPRGEVMQDVQRVARANGATPEQARMAADRYLQGHALGASVRGALGGEKADPGVLPADVPSARRDRLAGPQVQFPSVSGERGTVYHEPEGFAPNMGFVVRDSEGRELYRGPQWQAHRRAGTGVPFADQPAQGIQAGTRVRVTGNDGEVNTGVVIGGPASMTLVSLQTDDGTVKHLGHPARIEQLDGEKADPGSDLARAYGVGQAYRGAPPTPSGTPRRPLRPRSQAEMAERTRATIGQPYRGTAEKGDPGTRPFGGRRYALVQDIGDGKKALVSTSDSREKLNRDRNAWASRRSLSIVDQDDYSPNEVAGAYDRRATLLPWDEKPDPGQPDWPGKVYGSREQEGFPDMPRAEQERAIRGGQQAGENAARRSAEGRAVDGRPPYNDREAGAAATRASWVRRQAYADAYHANRGRRPTPAQVNRAMPGAQQKWETYQPEAQRRLEPFYADKADPGFDDLEAEAEAILSGRPAPKKRGPVTAADLKDKSIADLSDIIQRDWTNPNYAAAPYLSAMRHLGTPDDSYGMDSGREIIPRFLYNASTWKGDTARAVKAELKRRMKQRPGEKADPGTATVGGMRVSAPGRAGAIERPGPDEAPEPIRDLDVTRRDNARIRARHTVVGPLAGGRAEKLDPGAPSQEEMARRAQATIGQPFQGTAEKGDPGSGEMAARERARTREGGMAWEYNDARGVKHVGFVENTTDRGGTDVTYYFRDLHTGELTVRSDLALKDDARSLGKTVGDARRDDIEQEARDLALNDAQMWGNLPESYREFYRREARGDLDGEKADPGLTGGQLQSNMRDLVGQVAGEVAALRRYSADQLRDIILNSPDSERRSAARRVLQARGAV